MVQRLSKVYAHTVLIVSFCLIFLQIEFTVVAGPLQQLSLGNVTNLMEPFMYKQMR